ncbi:MAG: 2-amino-4-hydroxy-6-hydroxymethyldihydropteridine diphosphokinase [Puniceicoccales bacterium]|jgi:2-amino-4-hydroxy-6-hydroxymethyldihydropteridine diphosphokinase|nr:2-amino-4-hydroxy-6-hydroxymethyldihydropteridine diphosphokinase [Puniceicoccales bacterium]
MKNEQTSRLRREGGRQALLAFGSNLGDREAHLAAAVAEIGCLAGTQVLGISSLYETKPVGIEAQPDFLNAAGAVVTHLTPEELLEACLGIEEKRGRERGERNGPRTLDIDLLFYEGETRATPRLTLPHPRYAERDFVRVPLRELLEMPALRAESVWDDLRQEMAATKDKLGNGVGRKIGWRKAGL